MAEDMEAAWLLGREIDLGAYLATANALRRLLTTVGLKRVPKDLVPDLKSYLRSQSAEASDA